jgi:hypothetical protein
MRPLPSQIWTLNYLAIAPWSGSLDDGRRGSFGVDRETARGAVCSVFTSGVTITLLTFYYPQNPKDEA